MAFTKPPKKYTSVMHPAPRSQGYRTVPGSPIEPDAIDDILGLCLIWVLPAFSFAGILVLGTMLISHTLVMRVPLPRQFALIIVIFFASLIMITFFLLATFHMRRCQRRIPLRRAHLALTESSASIVNDGEISGSRSSSHCNKFSQSAGLNVGAVVVPAPAQNFCAIPLRKVKCHANLKQAAQDQGFNKAVVALGDMGAVYESTHSSRPSSNSSLEIQTIHDDQWPLRPSLPRRPSPLIIPSSSSGDAPPIVPFVPERPKEEVVYYLPPGPPSPLPSPGSRPEWADDIEDKMVANLEASGKDRKWWKSRLQWA